MKVGDSVWYCKKLAEPSSDGNMYSAPIEVKTSLGIFTVVDSRGYLDILEFGNDVKKYATAIAQPYERWKNEFAEGDLFYCNGNQPSENEDFYGEKANFVVDNVDYGNLRIKLTLKKVAY